jgi:P4 family phage/plasmid primase-like protien
MNDILPAVLQLADAGISVVPVIADGSKRPAVKWAEYQHTRPSRQQLHDWFTSTTTPYGIGVITGRISGNLEMLEIEGRGANQLTELADLATKTGIAELWTRICTGWLELSPSGGIHWFYRVQWADKQKPAGNQKVATRPSTATELATNPKQRKQVIAETRGEGGYTVAAPSNGTCHPTGKPWVRLAGGPDAIPVLTIDERETLHALLGTLHEPDPEPPAQDTLTPHPDTDPDGLRPGEDYENKTDWADILTGWTLVHTAGTTRYWRRPGKNIGISATTGHAEDRDRLYVFTTSTEFDTETPYTKFGAYALLHHGGNHQEAASALRKKGHGDPLPLERPITLKPFTPITGQHEKRPPAAPETEGTAALATVTPLPVRTTTTDHGNAGLLVNRHGNEHRYIPEHGKWAHWDGTRWAREPDPALITQAAAETIQSIDATGNADLHQHKRRSLSRRALEAAVALARSDPRVRVPAAGLDAHPYELNTPTGIINLRTGELGPHDRTRYHTKTAGVGYNPDAPAPAFHAFLDTTFNGDQEMIRYVQRLAGYAATGHVTEHVLPFFHGSGGNGKGVFLELLLAVLGDYATTAPAGFLMAGREHHETEIARLAGMRLIVCSEVNQKARFDEAKVKLLTGGDWLTARYMNQDHFTFIPTHTLIVMGNHQPRVEAGGDSFWRRLRLVPFLHSIPEDQKDPELAARLIAQEGPGILNWLVAGAVDALAHGLRDPDKVRAATHEYAEEEDALARFIDDKCTRGPATGFRIDTSLMRREYDAWCREQGEQPLSPQQFGRDLKARYDIGQAKSNGKRYYTGITIFKNEPETPEHWSNK